MAYNLKINDFCQSYFKKTGVQFSAQSCPTLGNPMTAAHQASLSITNSQSLFTLMSIESVMPSNYPLLSPSPVFNLSQHQGFF